MKILLAASDRDLLEAYERLLCLNGHEVTIAFDGTQVVALLARGPFGLAILEESLPRMEHDALVRLLQGEGIPVLALIRRPLSSGRLLGPCLANAYLAFPFLPCEMTAMVKHLREKADNESVLLCGDVAVEISRFRIAGTQERLTAGEIDLFAALLAEKPIRRKAARAQIAALNEKFNRQNKRTRIEYVPQKGYRLVTKHD